MLERGQILPFFYFSLLRPRQNLNGPVWYAVNKCNKLFFIGLFSGSSCRLNLIMTKTIFCREFRRQRFIFSEYSKNNILLVKDGVGAESCSG